jgi:nucleoid-associated protein YgaU
VKTFFGIAAICTTLAFFAVPVRVSAQQAEKDIFIDPVIGNIARVSHYADLKKYRVEWEVLDDNHEQVVPRAPFSGIQNVGERFVTTQDQYYKVMAGQEDKKQEIIIEWDGKTADRYAINVTRPVTYLLYIYDVPSKGHGGTELRRIPVTILPPLKRFTVDLPKTVNKRTGETLLVNVSPPQEAYSWRVTIKDSNTEEIIVNRFYKEINSEFPGFSWNDYGDLDLDVYSVIVEAVDRAGNPVSNGGSFQIVDEEPIVSNRPGLGPNENGPKETLTFKKPPYEVERGDTLRKISNTLYETPHLWGLIYELNRSNFPRREPSPHVILPYMKLEVPTRESLERLGIIQAK